MEQPTSVKKYHVTLTDDERSMLRNLLSAGKGPARMLTHARILLKADESGESSFGGEKPGQAGGTGFASADVATEAPSLTHPCHVANVKVAAAWTLTRT